MKTSDIAFIFAAVLSLLNSFLIGFLLRGLV